MGFLGILRKRKWYVFLQSDDYKEMEKHRPYPTDA